MHLEFDQREEQLALRFALRLELVELGSERVLPRPQTLRQHLGSIAGGKGADENDATVALGEALQGGGVAREAGEVAVDAELQVGIRDALQRERRIVKIVESMG